MKILYLLLLVIIAILLQRYSTSHCLDGMSYEILPEKQLVECDEVFSVRSVLRNKKLLPILFLKLSETVPISMKIEQSSSDVARKSVRNAIIGDNDEIWQTMYLMPKQMLSRELHVSFPERGRYLFRTATMTGGDLLGFQEITQRIDLNKEIVVMPKRVDSASLNNAFGNYMGDISVQRFILSDPILTVGFRDYTGREPQRDISWPATLRRGGNHLMVKQYDYTAEITATVILDIHNGTEAEIERCYSYARTICELLESKRVSYGFFTDARCADALGLWNHIGFGLGHRHLFRILEGLGRATYEPTRSLESTLLHTERECETSSGFVLITPKLDAEGLAAVRSFESRNSRKVMVLQTELERGKEYAG